MKTPGNSSENWKQVEKAGEFLLKVSALTFALSIPTSIALDNFAAFTGLIGLILLLISRGAGLELPPVKPLAIFLLPQVIHFLKNPLKLFKSTCLKQYLVAYFVGYRAALSRSFLKKVAVILSLSAMLLSLSVIFEALTGQNIKHLNLHSLHLLKGIYRAEGLLNNALTTGGVLYVTTPLLLVFYLIFREKKFALAGLTGLAGLIVNMSRSYWLGLIVFALTLTVTGLTVREFRRAAISGLLLLAITGGVVASVPQLRARALSTIDIKHNGSNKDRLTIWTAYIYSFKKDYSPAELLLGTGERATGLAVKHAKEACLKVYGERWCRGKNYLPRVHGGETHNIYLKFLSKYGIVGLLAYLFFWAYAIWKNLKAFIKRKELPFAIFTATYAGFLTAGFFENNFTDAEVMTAILFTLGINFALLSQGNAEKPPCQREA